jgi:hypothetical protein
MHSPLIVSNEYHYNSVFCFSDFLHNLTFEYSYMGELWGYDCNEEAAAILPFYLFF